MYPVIYLYDEITQIKNFTITDRIVEINPQFIRFVV